jgi:hypothetical protein
MCQSPQGYFYTLFRSDFLAQVIMREWRRSNTGCLSRPCTRQPYLFFAVTSLTQIRMIYFISRQGIGSRAYHAVND